jgi:hypothetical protein
VSRRVSLPGADELFRQTTTLSAVPSVAPTPVEDQPEATIPTQQSKKAVRTTPRRRVNTFDRSPSGRERRGDLGLAVDRGRIVRESLAIIIADLESKGDQSIIARRLRGR